VTEWSPSLSPFQLGRLSAFSLSVLKSLLTPVNTLTGSKRKHKTSLRDVKPMFPLWHFLYARHNSYKTIIRFKRRRLGVHRFFPFAILHSLESVFVYGAIHRCKIITSNVGDYKNLLIKSGHTHNINARRCKEHVIFIPYSISKFVPFVVLNAWRRFSTLCQTFCNKGCSDFSRCSYLILLGVHNYRHWRKVHLVFHTASQEEVEGVGSADHGYQDMNHLGQPTA